MTDKSLAELVPLEHLNLRWTDTLRELARINATAPDLVANFRIQQIDGDSILLVTSNRTFYDQLNDPRRIKAVEKAFYGVHNHRLYVRLGLSEGDHIVSPPMRRPLVTVWSDGSVSFCQSDKTGYEVIDLLERAKSAVTDHALNAPVIPADFAAQLSDIPF